MSIGNSKISVIIPVYNAEKYLDNSINSIINQTYKNLEIIIIDDGSEDRSRDIVNYYKSLDNRIITLNQKNQGVSIARNTGLKIATGEYIFFMDSDDWIDNTAIEYLYKSIINTKSDIACLPVIRYRKFYKKYNIYYKAIQSAVSLEEKIKLCNIPKCCYVWGKLYKSNLVKNKYFKEYTYFEDILWLPEVIKNSKKIVSTINTNYYYRVNKFSIVKSKQNNKKQSDSYKAKKYIVDYFNENNIALDEKEKNITKNIFYFFNFPVLKIKEKKFINKLYLFSFIPILKYKDFDSHYIFSLWKIKINIKHKTNFNYEEVKEYGLNKLKRNPRLIVSLTTHTPRIKYVQYAINTLLNQTLKPDKVILWLSDEDFKNKEQDLPKELIELRKYGLEISWCENLLSYKKIIPALQKYPNDIIITADDDIFYSKKWLESLYSEYLKNPKLIYVKRSVRMKIVNNEIRAITKKDRGMFDEKEESYTNQLMSGSGCLFPPNSLYKDIYDISKFMNLIPTHDDIYLWIMAILKGTKIKNVGGYSEEMLTINGTENSGLCKINHKNSKGLDPNEAFKRMIQEYPEIINILK